MKVIQSLKLIRENKKISRETISNYLSISQSTYKDIENERIRLTLENFLLICKFLEISPMELLKDDDEHYILLTTQDIKALNELTAKINNQQINKVNIKDNHGIINFDKK
jgi:transcriptional regulator with XRE-family HTH domain